MEATDNSPSTFEDLRNRTPALLRTILPAVSPDPAYDASLSKPMIRRTGIPARAACYACRQRKSRCSGGRPKCDSCQTRNVECIYDTASKGETRVQALKRKNTEAESYERLIKLLCSEDSAVAADVFARLRQGAKPDTILRHKQDGDLLLQLRMTPETRYRYEFPYRPGMPPTLGGMDNPYLSSVVYQCSLTSSGTDEPLAQTLLLYEQYRDLYLKPVHAAEVVDPLLETVQPSKWTNICKDDALMRKFLAVYFMNEYQSLTAFHKDYFLQDMAAGRNRYCSRLLVNAVMAMACLCCKDIPKRYEYWDPQSLGYQFLSEAKRLWELDAHEDRLTTIHAAPLLNVVHNMRCQDKLGWLYTAEAVKMATRMGLFVPSTRPISQRERCARDFTAWALFTFQNLHCFLLFEAPLLLRPPDIPLPDPDSDRAWYSEVYLRYPSSGRLCPVNFPHLFRARAGVRTIMNDMLVTCFGHEIILPPERRLSIGQAKIFTYRLETWYSQLPRSLSASKAVLPSHLLLHINYQNALINLYDSFLKSGLTEEGYHPWASREAASKRLETLIRLYYLRHGFECADVFLIQPLSFMAFDYAGKLMKDPHGPDAEFYRSFLILAAKGLWDQGQNFHVARTALCLLRQQLQSGELRLLEKEVDIRDEKGPTNKNQLAEIRSRWPPFVSSMTADDTEGQRLSELVKQCMRMSIEDDDADTKSVVDEYEESDATAAACSASPATMTNGSSQLESPPNYDYRNYYGSTASTNIYEATR